MDETTASLVRTLDALLAGSSSTRPSRLPKMLWPTQLRMRQLRAANIGASTDFSRVSPVLPSLPPMGDRFSEANSWMAGNEAPSDGVKLTYGQPRSMAAQ